MTKFVKFLIYSIYCFLYQYNLCSYGGFVYTRLARISWIAGFRRGVSEYEHGTYSNLSAGERLALKHTNVSVPIVNEFFLDEWTNGYNRVATFYQLGLDAWLAFNHGHWAALPLSAPNLESMLSDVLCGDLRQCRTTYLSPRTGKKDHELQAFHEVRWQEYRHYAERLQQLRAAYDRIQDTLPDNDLVVDNTVKRQEFKVLQSERQS